FEVANVDRVESYQCREEPPIRFGQMVATKIPVCREVALQHVEGREQRANRFLIGRLCWREAGFVHAVIDGRIDTRVEGIDDVPELDGIEIAGYRPDRVEGRVQHPNDLGRLVRYDHVALFVPQHRYRNPARVRRIRSDIDLMEIARATDRIGNDTRPILE